MLTWLWLNNPIFESRVALKVGRIIIKVESNSSSTESLCKVIGGLPFKTHTASLDMPRTSGVVGGKLPLGAEKLKQLLCDDTQDLCAMERVHSFPNYSRLLPASM